MLKSFETAFKGDLGALKECLDDLAWLANIVANKSSNFAYKIFSLFLIRNIEKKTLFFTLIVRVVHEIPVIHDSSVCVCMQFWFIWRETSSSARFEENILPNEKKTIAY